jgi:hypothetical protein
LRADGDVENADVATVAAEHLDAVEADSYWCVSRLLDGIHDHYTSAQPGIQRKIKQLEDLTTKLDGV